MEECYVCLEETNETSPCTCSAPIHNKCFLEMQAHTHRPTCSICKRPFDMPITCKDICNCIYALSAILFMGFFAWFALSHSFSRLREGAVA